ncbi:MAG: hypothetical protein H6726_18605 [Sandaracinaceae bacterium]|nr:hypothetical protein [Sandaracinaceae bacterium]
MKRVLALATQVLTCGLPWLAVGCASAPPAAAFSPELAPSAVEPASLAERELLRRAPELPSGESVDVSGLHVVAAAPYAAASGRMCRELEVDQRPRLACATEGGWVFVPVLIEGP